jgi:hypothetical protein
VAADGKASFLNAPSSPLVGGNIDIVLHTVTVPAWKDGGIYGRAADQPGKRHWHSWPLLFSPTGADGHQAEVAMRAPMRADPARSCRSRGN